MASERNAFKLGLAMLLFVALFVVVLWYLAPRGTGDMPLVVRYAHDEFDTMLKPGSLVVCGGKPVGQVTSMKLKDRPLRSGGTELDVYIGIEIASWLGLREDCTIVPEGPLLGEGGKLVIRERGKGEPVQPHDVVEGTVGTSLATLTRQLSNQLDPNQPGSLMAMIRSQLNPEDAASLVGKIHAVLDNLTAVTAGLRTQLDPNERAALMAKLHRVLDNLVASTHVIREELSLTHPSDQHIIDEVHGLLNTLDDALVTFDAILTENREPIRDTVANVRDATEIIESKIVARIADQLDVSQPASLMAKVHVAVGSLGSALKDLNDVTSAARETILTNRALIDRAIVNFKDTSEQLRLAAADIRRNPWRLLYQPSVEEAREANLFDAARAFSEAASRLDDAVVRLKAYKESRDDKIPADDKQLVELREELKATFEKFHKAEQALWKELEIE